MFSPLLLFLFLSLDLKNRICTGHTLYSRLIRVVYKLPIGRVRLVVHIVTPKFVRSLVRPTRPFVRSPVLVENRRIFPNTVQVVPL